jgi:transketolase
VPSPGLDQLCITALRCLAVDAVQKANAGHPGMPMGAAPMGYVIWQRHLRHNPADPQWVNRDRFVLSPGHGCMLLYSLLHLTGYDLSLEDLKNFRQFGSRCPGHSEYGHTPGVETTTGPLGQGFSSGVGMAIARKYLAAYFNRPGHEIVDYTIYGIVSDGDLMEGVAGEAASLAGHLKLDDIIYLYDDNRVTIEGHTSLAFTEDRRRRFEAYGWHVQTLPDGNDVKAIHRAILKARRVRGRPHLIAVRTIIGYGSPNKADTADVHGAPLGPDEVKLTKTAYGWDPAREFFVPPEVHKEFRMALRRGRRARADWEARFARYREAFPELAQQFEDWRQKKLPAGWDEGLPDFAGEKEVPTRAASGKVLGLIGPRLPMLIGGSADLHPSTSTYVKATGDFQQPENEGDRGSYAGRNLHFGVREHAMAAAVNGMALSHMLIPYGATFLIFSDYCKPSLRLAAMMKVRSIFVFTHDSIGLGEDGATHQPVEQLGALRSVPGLVVIRPSDATEVPFAWKAAIERRDGPTCIILTRQKVNVLDRAKFPPAANLLKGAYILAGDANGKPDLILISAGSELHFALGAGEELAREGVKVRVVAMPSMELFEAQPQEYRDAVLPPAVRARVAVEAGHPMSWHKYVGLDGAVVGMTTFGGSAPFKVLYDKFGFTPENIAKVARKVLGRS